MKEWQFIERAATVLNPQKAHGRLRKGSGSSMNMGILCNRSVGAVHDFLLASSGSYELLKRKSNEPQHG